MSKAESHTSLQVQGGVMTFFDCAAMYILLMIGTSNEAFDFVVTQFS